MGVFSPSSTAVCSHAGMALDAAAAAAAVDSLSASLLPRPFAPLRSPPLPRTNRNGFFQANLSLSPRRWRQPKCESRGGGEGRLHPLPAIAVRRLLLWSHTRKTFPVLLRKIFHKHAARTVAFAKVNGFLDLSVSTLFCESVFRCSRRSWLDVCVCVVPPPPPLRIQASDNGASRGNLATSLLAKPHLRAMLSG